MVLLTDKIPKDRNKCDWGNIKNWFHFSRGDHVLLVKISLCLTIKFYLSVSTVAQTVHITEAHRFSPCFYSNDRNSYTITRIQLAGIYLIGC